MTVEMVDVHTCLDRLLDLRRQLLANLSQGRGSIRADHEPRDRNISVAKQALAVDEQRNAVRT